MADQKELEQNVEPKHDLNEDGGIVDKSAVPEQAGANKPESNQNVQEIDLTPMHFESGGQYNEFIWSVVQDLPLLSQFSIEHLQAIYQTCVNGERDLLHLLVNDGQRARQATDRHNYALVIIRNRFIDIRNHVGQIIQNHSGNRK